MAGYASGIRVSWRAPTGLRTCQGWVIIEAKTVRRRNHDKSPFVAVSNAMHGCRLGWPAIADELQQAIAKGRSENPILVVEC
jgi:hypothetical protein